MVSFHRFPRFAILVGLLVPSPLLAQQADLAVSITGETLVKAAARVIHHVKITNRGPNSASNVSAVIRFPLGSANQVIATLSGISGPEGSGLPIARVVFSRDP